ncbi:MAG: hypothetical protein WHS46_10460 [Desulfosoma sp.]
MRPIGIPALCLWMLLGILSEWSAAEKPYTPGPGSTERRAVLNAFRLGLQNFPQNHHAGFQYLRNNVGIHYDEPVRFLVDWIRIQNAWAWVEARDQKYGRRFCGLLHNEDGSWKLLAIIQPDGVVCDEKPAQCLDLRNWLYARMRLKFPDASPAIFPEVSKEQLAVLRTLVGVPPYCCDLVFWVTHFGHQNDWVWIETEPRSKDGTSGFEPIDALLQKVQGEWVVREVRPCCGDCADDPDCDDPKRYYQKLMKRFPTAPKEIFPARWSHW